MKIRKLLLGSVLLLSLTASAQPNQFRFYYGAVPNTPAATITAGSITIPYKLEVTNLSLTPPMVSSGGRIAAHVFLQGVSSDYYVGEFHHSYTYGTSTYGVSAPGYPANPSFIPQNTPASSYSPVFTTTQTATIPISSACIPNGTYTVRLDLYALMPSCEVPDLAWVSFKVNSTTTNPPGVLINSNMYDVYFGKLGSGSLGSLTISGSSSAFAPAVSSTAGTCSNYGSLSVTATGATGPFTLSYRKINSPNNYGPDVTVNSASSPVTGAVTSAGNYDVFLTDGNGCEWYDIVTVAATPAPTVTITPGAQTVSVGTCIGFNATASSGTGYSYNWKMSHASQPATTVATTAYTCQTIPTPGGSGRYRPAYYQVTMSNAYCTGTATRTITADTWYLNTSGNGCCAPNSRIGENADSAAAVLYNVFPNPASNQLTVTFEGLNRANVTLEILDVTGKIIRTQALADGSSRADLDVSDLSAGIYVIRLYTGEEQLMNQSFVRE
ncbi:MAG: T9SS type A sorting domain-containing protein [Bacteroidia bacterium]